MQYPPDAEIPGTLENQSPNILFIVNELWKKSDSLTIFIDVKIIQH